MFDMNKLENSTSNSIHISAVAATLAGPAVRNSPAGPLVQKIWVDGQRDKEVAVAIWDIDGALSAMSWLLHANHDTPVVVVVVDASHRTSEFPYAAHRVCQLIMCTHHR